MKYKLIVFDMDGVIFVAHNFWMKLHHVFGTFEKGRELTDKYLLTDYAKLVEEVVDKLWKGKDATPYFGLVDSVEYYEGVKETFDELRKRGYRIAVITCGPGHLIERMERDGMEFDYAYYNTLSIEDNKVKGEFDWPVAEGHDKKVTILKRICAKEGIKPHEVITIADGKSDYELMKASGFKIAFCPTSDKIRIMADVVIDRGDLR
ncbi:HAD family phosphatase, partial [Candidatus Woesearchaeota archaeon]|nr:HAD family phosphatase [Candidatus Woesearchaeota archaeon]